ncbi:duplicated orphan permease [Dyadobacter sp. SG02]|uniref:ABC transporter permease n=1 Tax=Dyadobacter sp. SG02 TaxID=1855291 RepID=UPI0008D580BE|nr:ABC transporter permease [Dyadobacter sp. SG02]SEJ04679.1 duplicated orphan permease [Dyadobacter sp. SG02]
MNSKPDKNQDPADPAEPPRWAARLLARWSQPDAREELQGDMLEMYAYWLESLGKPAADRKYALAALRLMRPFARPKRANDYSETYSFSAAMIQNYFKIAFRNLLKSKTFSAINVLGLALGMACSLMIMLWIRDELAVDAFHANKDQLYRIYMREHFSGKVQGVIWTPGPLAEELKKSVPEIEMSTPYSWTNQQTFSVGSKIHKQATNWASADFFKMFSYKLLQGTAEGALRDRGNIAISRTMANAFFGSPEAAIGKAIRYDNRKEMTVSAVFENIGANSSLQFDCLMTWDAYIDDNSWATHWSNTDPLTFFKLRKDADPAKVEAKMLHLLDKTNRDGSKPYKTQLAMQPFHEYYLNSNIKDAKMDGGRIEYVRLFSFVAVFILLIACINFMNLATARSSRRAKEVGVRKVVGAMRSMLAGQFMGEALLIAGLSAILAVLLVALLLPAFNSLTSKQMALPYSEPKFWGIIGGLLVATGLLAGSYPALFLSSLNPVRILKGALKFDSSSVWVRQGLVVFQFALSVILIVGMIIIYRQVGFVQTKNLGFDRENLVYFPIEGELFNKFDLLKTQLTQIPGIKQVSHMTATPASNGNGTDGITWPGSNPNEQVRFTPVGVGYDFTKTMNLKMADGRDFSKDYPTDSSGVILNETAIKVMGLKNPVGREINWGTSKVRIVGVLKDFHFVSLHSAIRPLIAYLGARQPQGSVVIRIQAGKTPETLAAIGQVCKKLNPNVPFSYAFTDQEYARQYQSEQIVGKLAGYFASLAIFISCLGLFGLAAFTAEQRTKEIGVRKVLGASVAGIVGLLSKDFLKLVVMAIILASPVAWYIMKQWLQGFAYQIDIEWWMFALAGVIAVLIAVFTISFQSIKAAMVNPVRSLRSE